MGMRRAWLGVLAVVLMLAGCAGGGAARGQAGLGPDCGHPAMSPNAPGFFVTRAGAPGACGFTYGGEPSGRMLKYTPCLEACAQPRPSPDGHFTLTGFMVTDTASGRVVGQVPDDVLDSVWATDSRHLCGVRGGPAVPVVLEISALRGRPKQVRLAPLFTSVPHSNTALIVCDPRHARAVLQASYQHVTAVAVVSLSNGALLAEHDFPDTSGGFPEHSTPVVTAVSASADGRYLAVLHAIQPGFSPPDPGTSPAAMPTTAQPALAATPGKPAARATPGQRAAGATPRKPAATPTPGQPAVTSPVGPPPPVPAYMDVFDIAHPGQPVTRLAGAQAATFSGDGALLAEQVPRAHGGDVTRVVRWSDGKIIWQSTETMAGEATSPGVPVIAVETYQPGRPADQIVLLRPDGRTIPVAAGRLAVP